MEEVRERLKAVLAQTHHLEDTPPLSTTSQQSQTLTHRPSVIRFANAAPLKLPAEERATQVDEEMTIPKAIS